MNELFRNRELEDTSATSAYFPPSGNKRRGNRECRDFPAKFWRHIYHSITLYLDGVSISE